MLTRVALINKYGILFIIGIVLANFTTKTNYSLLVVWLGSTVFLGLFSLYFFINRKDTPYFLLFLVIGSHFTFATDLGGLFNILAVFILSIKFFTERDVFISVSKRLPWLVHMFFFCLIVFNLMSTFLNNTSALHYKLLGLLSFLGCILIFFYATEMRKVNTAFVLKVGVTLAMLNTIAAINQRFLGISINSLILPLVYQGEDFVMSANSSGTIGSSALFGELSLLIFVFLIYYRFLSANLPIGNLRLVNIGIVLSILNVVLSNSRSVVIIAVTSIAFLIFILIKKNKLKYLIKLSVGMLMIVIIGSWAGLFNYIIEKLSLVDLQSLSFSGIFSGEDINRGIIFDFAIKRLTENPWFLGHGYGVHGSNAFAWSGGYVPGLHPGESKFSDIHSLYLGLPMLFGWVGAICYLSIFLYVIFKLIRSLKRLEGDQYAYTFGLVMFWVVFLINEYKTSVLALPHYHLLIWAILGYSNSVVNSFRSYDDSLILNEIA